MTGQIVYFFDGKPTIGYCPRCEVTAIYMEEKGLICPVCESRNLSHFLWDKVSNHPGKSP